MTVTLVAGYLKAFDIGKWVSVDRNGVWETFKLDGMGISATDISLLSHSAQRLTTVEPFDYIQLTAALEDGSMPRHLEGERPVQLEGQHGDLNMK